MELITDSAGRRNDKKHQILIVRKKKKKASEGGRKKREISRKKQDTWTESAVRLKGPVGSLLSECQLLRQRKQIKTLCRDNSSHFFEIPHSVKGGFALWCLVNAKNARRRRLQGARGGKEIQKRNKNKKERERQNERRQMDEIHFLLRYEKQLLIRAAAAWNCEYISASPPRWHGREEEKKKV